MRSARVSTAELSRGKVRHVPPERPYGRSAGLRRRPGFGGPRCCGSTPGSTRKSRRGRIILTHLGRVLVGPALRAAHTRLHSWRPQGWRMLCTAGWRRTRHPERTEDSFLDTKKRPEI